MQIRSILCGFALLVTLCARAAAQAPGDAAAFEPETWPGSREQAERLASERKDMGWSQSMEPRIADALRALPDWEVDGLSIECRTSLCGVVVELDVGRVSPAFGSSSASETAAVSAPLRLLFRGLGFNAFTNVIALDTNQAGNTVANVEWTAIDSTRTPAERGEALDRLLLPAEVSALEAPASGRAPASAPSLSGPVESGAAESGAADSRPSGASLGRNGRSTVAILPGHPELAAELPALGGGDLNYPAELLAAEADDAGWARDMERQILAGVASWPRPLPDLIDVECRTTWCGLAFDLSGFGEAGFMPAFAGYLESTLGFASHATWSVAPANAPPVEALYVQAVR